MSPLWKAPKPLVLASTSATRLHLLTSCGLPVETVAPDVDERAIESGLQSRRLAPDRIALELARAKGAQVSVSRKGRLVVAADQTLSLDGRQFHKPRSVAEARIHLRDLAGRRHALHSAVVCHLDGACLFEDVQSAHLTMRDLSETFLDAYLATVGESVAKSVGGYQIEGVGLHLFERVDGDHATILGLPLQPLLGFLRTFGAIVA